MATFSLDEDQRQIQDFFSSRLHAMVGKLLDFMTTCVCGKTSRSDPHAPGGRHGLRADTGIIVAGEAFHGIRRVPGQQFSF